MILHDTNCTVTEFGVCSCGGFGPPDVPIVASARMHAMGIEADKHFEWCSIYEMGICSCGNEGNPAIPASEASAGSKHTAACPMPYSGDCSCGAAANAGCDDPHSSHGCCKQEANAASHLEAMKLLRQAQTKLTDALALLGEV